MKFKQEDIARASKDLALLIDKSSTVPILSNVCVRVTGDVATFTATNLDQQATISIPVESDADISFTIPGDKLASISGVASGSLAMEFKDGFVTAKSGKSKWKLPTLAAADFPVLRDDIDGASFEIDSERLKGLFENVAGAMSIEDAQYYLRGIYVHSVNGNLKLATTDGKVLSAIECDDIKYDGPGVIVPAGNVAQVIKMMAGYNGPVTVTIGDRVSYQYGNVTLSSKVVDGSFPDYQRVIDGSANNDKIVRFARADMAASIKRATILADEKTRAINLDIGKGRIVLTVAASDGGVATDEVLCDYTGEPFKYRCNGVYLANQINAAGDEIEIAGFDENSPIRLTSASNKGYVGILMGMRS